MRPHEIENWALSVVQRVRAGHPNEDSRVELKRDWINAEKAARRIAAHANAARGAPILWLIGVDQNGQIPGVQHQDLGPWFGRVQAQFDGLAPRLTDLNIPVEGTTIVALLFETERAPFVVKNPRYGTRGAGPVSLEVPWREGTATRSATRADLLQILSPLQAMPNFQVLEGTLHAKTWGHYNAELDANERWIDWKLTLILYATVPNYERVIIPYHQCRATLEIPDQALTRYLENVTLRPPTIPSVGSSSMTIGASQDELILDGSGKVILNADLRTSFPELGIPQSVQPSFEPSDEAMVTVTCLPVHAPHRVVIDCRLPRSTEHDRSTPSPEFHWHSETVDP
jgi:hypothetical protein